MTQPDFLSSILGATIIMAGIGVVILFVMGILALSSYVEDLYEHTRQKSEAKRYWHRQKPKTMSLKSRSMTGFLQTMTNKQQKAARDYRGDDTHGQSFSADEITAGSLKTENVELKSAFHNYNKADGYAEQNSRTKYLFDPSQRPKQPRKIK
jgi:hypothetical protein